LASSHPCVGGREVASVGWDQAADVCADGHGHAARAAPATDEYADDQDRDAPMTMRN
jgi:hypothetical protein